MNMSTKWNQREKLIIENELKFDISKKTDFKNIFDYLNSKYDIIPYKNAEMYDYYYDTADYALHQKGISYRIRYRPQISINIKLPQKKTGYIWSRFEYSCKVDKKHLPLNIIYGLNCEINKILKDKLNIDPKKEFINTAIVNSYRIGFNIRYKNKNILGENDLLGVAFFDQTTNLTNSTSFCEFELESYEQTDVFASPYIFDDFNQIGSYIASLGHSPSNQSKYERCILGQ